MNWKRIFTMLLVVLAISALPNFACPLTPSADNDNPEQDRAVLALAGSVVVQNILENTVEVQGTWSCLSNTDPATFVITSSTISYSDAWTTTPIVTNIRLVQSSQNRMYYQNPSTGSNPNKFFRFLWTDPITSQGSKVGLCYDGFCPNGCSDTLDGMTKITSTSSSSNLTSGCSNYYWNLCTKTN